MKKTKLRWMKLDNAAKIYPAAKRRNWVMFKPATLTENVTLALQNVLIMGQTFHPFLPASAAAFLVLYRRAAEGTENSNGSLPPLAHMSLIWYASAHSGSFTMKPDAIEVFHALTDERRNGILKTLLQNTLKKSTALLPPSHGVLNLEEDPEEELEDSFLVHAGHVKEPPWRECL